MSRESVVKALLLADNDLMAILTGGVYTDEELGPEGFRRGDGSPANPAFDPNTGFILPSVYIKVGGEIPMTTIRDLDEQFVGLVEIVSLYFLQHRGNEVVRQATRRSYSVLQGVRLGKSFPIWMESQSQPVPDGGPVANSTVMSQNFVCVSTRVG